MSKTKLKCECSAEINGNNENHALALMEIHKNTSKEHKIRMKLIKELSRK